MALSRKIQPKAKKRIEQRWDSQMKKKGIEAVYMNEPVDVPRITKEEEEALLQSLNPEIVYVEDIEEYVPPVTDEDQYFQEEYWYSRMKTAKADNDYRLRKYKEKEWYPESYERIEREKRAADNNIGKLYKKYHGE